MTNTTKRFRGALLASTAAGVLALTGCSSDDDTAQLRVIHASPDAPAVNVQLDSNEVISNLDYADSSGYLEVGTGLKDITVEAIIPGGNADVISVPAFPLINDGRVTVIAVNTTTSIEALVADESSASPASGEVAIAVIHASPAAGTVDVYVTAPDTDINNVDPDFSFDFKGEIDAGALPADTYRIRVTQPGTKTVVFDSGPVDLSSFAGQKLMLVAVSTTSSIAQAASPIKLLVATDTSDLTLLDSGTSTGARVVHASPDAGTAAGGPVEVFATSTALPASPAELIDAFSYTDIVPAADAYVGVPAGDYVFDVAPDGTGIGSSVYTSPSVPLAQGSDYTVVATGYVLTTPAFTLLATEDQNRSVVTQASVKVIHAAPAAGTVDVYVTPAGDFTASDVENGLAGAPLLDDFEFGVITDYVAVAPGDYDIRVVAGGATAINVENFNLAAGSVSTVIARGPIDSGTPSDFNVILLTN
jgi:hypothetical protein